MARWLGSSLTAGTARTIRRGPAPNRIGLYGPLCWVKMSTHSCASQSWADTATTIGSRCHVLAGAATVLISTPTVEIIRAGFSVQIHNSARKAQAVAERAHAT
jgi:hypothetical protein